MIRIYIIIELKWIYIIITYIFQNTQIIPADMVSINPLFPVFYFQKSKEFYKYIYHVQYYSSWTKKKMYR